MTKTADKLEREFGLIKRDERGFADYDILAGFRARCAHAATGVEYPHGPIRTTVRKHTCFRTVLG